MPLAGASYKLRRCEPVKARVWLPGIAVDPPGFDDPAGFSEIGERMLVKAFVAQSAIEGLDEGVLHRLTSGDVVAFNTMLLLPGTHGA